MADANLDELDTELLRALADTPRAGVMELARRLGVARGTVQARLDKLQQRGVVTGFGPDLDARAMGYDVLSFTNLEIDQGRLDTIVDELRTVPEVLEAHTTTGAGDLHLRVVARDNEHLQDVINRILMLDGVERATTQIALTEPLSYRLLPLVTAATT